MALTTGKIALATTHAITLPLVWQLFHLIPILILIVPHIKLLLPILAVLYYVGKHSLHSVYRDSKHQQHLMLTKRLELTRSSLFDDSILVFT